MTDATVPNEHPRRSCEPSDPQVARTRAPERATSRRELVPLTRAPAYPSTTWGPYYEALHPPSQVHWIINWKVVPGRMDHAAGLWRRRQELRCEYEATHGGDPALWPTQHPGITLGANAACLGCNWFHAGGRYRHDGVFEQHFVLARRHEASNGAFRGLDNQ